MEESHCVLDFERYLNYKRELRLANTREKSPEEDS